MKMSYFDDTDTLYVSIEEKSVVDSKEFKESSLLDLDAAGSTVAFTVEHANNARMYAGSLSWESPPNKALQRTRIRASCFPWQSVRAAELGR